MFHLSEVGQKAIELRRVTSGLGIESRQIFQTRLELLTIPIGITPSGQDVRCLRSQSVCHLARDHSRKQQVRHTQQLISLKSLTLNTHISSDDRTVRRPQVVPSRHGYLKRHVTRTHDDIKELLRSMLTL